MIFIKQLLILFLKLNPANVSKYFTEFYILTHDSNVSLIFIIEFNSKICHHLSPHSRITAAWISFMHHIMIFARKKRIRYQCQHVLMQEISNVLLLTTKNLMHLF